jgi:hypothetical protein
MTPPNTPDLYELEHLEPEAQVRAAISAAELAAGHAGPVSHETLRALIDWRTTGTIPDDLKTLAEKAYLERSDALHASVARSANLCISHAAWSLWFFSTLAGTTRAQKVFAAARDSVSHARAMQRAKKP